MPLSPYRPDFPSRLLKSSCTVEFHPPLGGGGASLDTVGQQPVETLASNVATGGRTREEEGVPIPEERGDMAGWPTPAEAVEEATE